MGTLFFLKKDFMHPFLEKGEGREQERERNIDVGKEHLLVASPMWLNQELNLQPRHVP